MSSVIFDTNKIELAYLYLIINSCRDETKFLEVKIWTVIATLLCY